MTDKNDWDIDSWKLEDILDRRNDELAQLRAEVARLKEQVMWLNADTTTWRMSDQLGEQLKEINQLKAERDAAVVHGLEIAQDICDRYGSSYFANHIAAEIAKRQAKEPA